MVWLKQYSTVKSLWEKGTQNCRKCAYPLQINWFRRAAKPGTQNNPWQNWECLHILTVHILHQLSATMVTRLICTLSRAGSITSKVSAHSSLLFQLKAWTSWCTQPLQEQRLHSRATFTRLLLYIGTA